jgi:phage shock protein PspC (stress-responsive transcriptional regulator)
MVSFRGLLMICPSCQKEIADGSKFCYNCGTRLAPADAQTVPPPAPSAPVGRKLVRSTNDRKIAGVCAGVADYFDWDPTIVRLIWALATLVPGPNILVYVVLWIVLPQGPTAAYRSSVATNP